MNISPEILRRIAAVQTEIMDICATISDECNVTGVTDVTECNVTGNVTVTQNALRQRRHRALHSVTKGEGGYLLTSFDSVCKSEESKVESEEHSTLNSPTRRPRVRESEPSGFKAFMEAYPKRINRKAALSKWKIAVTSGVTEGVIRNAALRYAVTVCNAEYQFIKAPDVWLNKGCYLDELPLQPRTSPAGKSNGDRGFLQHVMRSIERDKQPDGDPAENRGCKESPREVFPDIPPDRG